MTVTEPDAGNPAPPLEYSVAFDGPEAWHSWSSRHAGALSSRVRIQALEAIRKNGIVRHPSGSAIPAEALAPVRVDGGDVIYAGETSPVRALLTAFEELSRSGTECEYSRRRLKIITRGFRLRHLAQLRKRYPFVVSMETGSASCPSTGFDLVLADLSAPPCEDTWTELSSLAGRLASHGRLIATLPFAPAPDTRTGPACSWPVIDALKGIGFGVTVIRWYASQSRGILGQRGSGVFVVDARKSPSAASLQTASPQGIVGLIGLPRSGTTMLTALLDAHSRIHGVYEPWNARVERYQPLLGKDDLEALGERDPFDLSVDEFINAFGIRMPPQKDWLLVKETTTMRPYIDAIEGLLSKPPQPSHRHLVWLVRDPFHVYLSELEARRKWWGARDLTHSQETFERWAMRTLRSTLRLRDLARRLNGFIVSYEDLVRAPRDTLSCLMAHLRMPFEEAQLDYHKTIRTPAVKGDNTVAQNPREVSDTSTVNRQREFEQLQPSISNLAIYKLIDECARWARGLSDKGVIDGDDAYADMLDPVLRKVPRKKKAAR